MRAAAALLAALYVATYLLAQAWRRRAPGRVVVVCPLRRAEAVPPEIVERLGTPVSVDDLDAVRRVEFTIAFLTDAPGISLASVTGESSLEEKIGPAFRRANFVPGKRRWPELLGRGRPSPALLFDLALEVLHHVRPRSLLVDFRPPPSDQARALGITVPETDLDLAMYAYEIRCRVRRYSRYRDAPVDLLFCPAEGGAWRLKG